MTPTLTHPKTTTDSDAALAVLAGAAIGDAWGYPVEFTTYAVLSQQYPDGAPYPAAPALISDDTQMSLAVTHALTTASRLHQDPRAHLIHRFLSWREDPDNNRAPGTTCMTALAHLAQDPTVPFDVGLAESKGCGTIMRTAPCAFLPEATRLPITVYQSVLTHAHPVAAAATAVFTELLHDILTITVPQRDLLSHAQRITRQLHDREYPNSAWQDWLGHVPGRAGYADASDYLRAGFNAVDTYLGTLATEASHWRPNTDVCEVAGGGWIAEETLGCALTITSHPQFADPVEAVRKAATSGGDSDSIASLVGAIEGALHGMTPLAHLFRGIEPRYQDDITRTAPLLAALGN